MCNDLIMNDIINGDIWIGMNEFYSFECLCQVCMLVLLLKVTIYMLGSDYIN